MPNITKAEDPYRGLVRNVRKMAGGAALQPSAGIGKIISPPPEIIVSYHGMELHKEFLWVDEYWLQGHTRHVVGETSYRGGGSGYPAYESHNHPVDNDETLTDTWKVGDYVEVTPVLGDDNRTTVQYIISKKLKRLDGN